MKNQNQKLNNNSLPPLASAHNSAITRWLGESGLCLKSYRAFSIRSGSSLLEGFLATKEPLIAGLLPGHLDIFMYIPEAW